jgi:catechol 2,3-dioxygenase-like lactoylglutathione lyase family enzyme
MDETRTPRPQLEVAAVTIGAPDPRRLAEFYQRLLGWTVAALEGPEPGRPEEDTWAQLRPPEGQPGPTLNFEYEAQYVRPAWPAEAGKQHATQHLDIAVSNLDEAEAWAVAAGAVRAEFQPQDDVRVMLDPSGQPFCLFAG